MKKILDKFEWIISLILLLVAMFVAGFQTIELIWELFSSYYNRLIEVGLSYEPEYTQTVVVLFFNVLLTLEIVETLKLYHKDHQTKIEIILIIVMIAISRKIFLIDIKHISVEQELAIAALILAFSVSYFLVRVRNQNKSAKLKN